MKATPFLVVLWMILVTTVAWPDEKDLVWSSFLGGSSQDHGYGIAVDESGCAYVTGSTRSADFPTTSGAFDRSYNGGTSDVFVTKLDPSGGYLYYSTFLGGDGSDGAIGIAVDESGCAYVTGSTQSVGFPTTPGAFDTTYDYRDAFVTKLNPTGDNLAYSTFLGGGSSDVGIGITVYGSGIACLTGWTRSANFPTTAGAYDTSYNGTSEYASDAFVAKLSPTGSALEYSTFLGGSGQDGGYGGIALDNDGNAYLAGYTSSDDFPTTAGAYDTTYNSVYNPGDVFVAKLNATGDTLDYSTFLGGSSPDNSSGIALDSVGNIYVSGSTTFADFPTTAGAFDTSYNGDRDVFVAKLNATGDTLYYCTFLGAYDYEESQDFAIDNAGNAYVTGQTSSAWFPTTAGAFDETFNDYEDAFVAKLDLSGYPVPVVSETPMFALPERYLLHQNYPNPFNAATEIRYQLSVNSHVTLKIFNTLGQEERTLVDSEQKAAGYRASWDGRDANGKEVATGIYFCTMKAGECTQTRKMVLLK